MTVQILILALVFMAVSGLVFGVVSWFNRRAAIQQRLDELGHADSTPEAGLTGDTKAVWRARVAKVAGPMARLSTPEEGWDSSALRLRFIHAGLRDASWPILFFAAKTVLALLLPAIFVLYQSLRPAGVQASSGSILLLVAAFAGGDRLLPAERGLVLTSRAGVSRNCARRCRMRWT